MLQDNVVSIDFGQGVDTKTDPKAVVPGKFTTLQNGVFTSAKRITKRNGYDALSSYVNSYGNQYTVASWSTVSTRENELVAVGSYNLGGPSSPTTADQRFLSYSPSQSAWVDKGKASSVSVSRQNISTTNYGGSISGDSFQFVGANNVNSLIIGNIIYYSWDVFPYGQGLNNPGVTSSLYSSSQGTYITAYDFSTGASLVGTPLSSSSLSLAYYSGYTKLINVNGSACVVFVSQTSTSSTSGTLKIVPVSYSNGALSFGSVTSIGTITNSSTSLANTFSPFIYDVCTDGSGGFFVVLLNYKTIYIYRYNGSFSQTYSNNFTLPGGSDTISALAITAPNNVWITGWVGGGSSTNGVWAAVYTSALVSKAAWAVQFGGSSLSYIALPHGTNAYACAQLTIAPIPLTTSGVQIFVTFYNTNTGYYTPLINNPTISYILSFSYLSGSTITAGSQEPLSLGLAIISRPAVLNNRLYVMMASSSQFQSTAFLIDSMDGYAVAKCCTNEAECLVFSGVRSGGSTFAPALEYARFPGFPAQLNLMQSGTSVQCAMSYVVEELYDAIGMTTSFDQRYGSPSSQWLFGVTSVVFDFANPALYSILDVNGYAVTNGGIVRCYDGQRNTELGFLQAPEIITTDGSGSGGSIGAATYTYYATLSFSDGLGNYYESEASAPFVVYLTGSTNQLTIYVQQSYTEKAYLGGNNTVQINLYRASSGTGGIAYLIGSTSGAGSLASYSGAYAAFLDKNSDSSLLVNYAPQLYTQNGAILPNTAPPASNVMWTSNSRIWAIDAEFPETQVEYSKTFAPGYGISFSLGELEYVCDSRGGPVVSAGAMDEKSVLFKQNAIAYFYGDGANDAGTQATITPLIFIPSEVGCSYSKSTCLSTPGYFFQTTRGIYLLSRGLQVQYIGFPVEQYNSQTITAATLTPTTNQIRFLTGTPNGYSLLFDSAFNQWSTFTNHVGVGATIWNGSYVYARNDGYVYTEDSSSFLDASTPYNLYAQTGWIPLQSIQNFQRVRWILFLGKYSNGTSASHGMQVQAIYDFGSYSGDTSSYLFGPASSAGVFQYRNFLSKQKCDSMSLIISETTTGASGEYVDLTNMAIVAAIKRGSQKVPASASVG